MKKYLHIKKQFESNKNEQEALQRKRYMRDKFVFYSLKTPLRRD